MKRFELCFSVDAETILVPDLLTVGEPYFGFNYDDALRYQLVYDFLPKSVIPRVIVNLNTDIDDKLRWRTGVVLEDRALAPQQ